jgi:hypothetical protein
VRPLRADLATADRDRCDEQNPSISGSRFAESAPISIKAAAFRRRTDGFRARRAAALTGRPGATSQA